MRLIKQVPMPCGALEGQLREQNIPFEHLEDTCDLTKLQYVASDGRKIVAVIDEVLPIDCDAYSERVTYYEQEGEENDAGRIGDN